MSLKTGKGGYADPPIEHQFKTGVSGNPKGRPKGVKPVAVEDIFAKVLGRRVRAAGADGEEAISMLQAICERMAVEAARGDRHARRDVLRVAAKLPWIGDPGAED
jgi:hypothetical protein